MNPPYSSRKKSSGHELLESLVTSYSTSTSSDLYSNSISLRSSHCHTNQVEGCPYCNTRKLNIPRI